MPWYGWLIIAVVVILVVIVVSWWISTRNKFVRLEISCDESLSGIDVYLKKRYDLIPNIVETVKGYAKHESATLENVIKARNAAMTATGDAKVQAENQLSGTLKSLFALSEAYPALKADTQFLNLQNQLQSIETDLSQARKYYNGTVKQYNTSILSQAVCTWKSAPSLKWTKRSVKTLKSSSDRHEKKTDSRCLSAFGGGVCAGGVFCRRQFAFRRRRLFPERNKSRKTAFCRFPAGAGL